MREQRERRDRRETQRASPLRGVARRPRAADGGGLWRHGAPRLAKEKLADRVEQRGAGEHHHHEGKRERVAGDFLDAVENLHRRDAREIEDQRHAQLGKGEDEDDGAAGKKARHDQRQRDPPKPPEARAAEVFCRLLHRGIEIRERGGQVQKEDRIEVQRIERDHAPHPPGAEPVDGLARAEHTQFHEQRIERAVLAEHLPNADGSDERRQDHRHEDRRGEELFPRKLKPVRHKSQRQREGQRRDRAATREQQRVAQSFEVDAVAENLTDEIPRHPPIRIHKGSRQHRPDRPHKKTREERGGERIDEPGESLRHRARAVAQAPVEVTAISGRPSTPPEVRPFPKMFVAFHARSKSSLLQPVTDATCR